MIELLKSLGRKPDLPKKIKQGNPNFWEILLYK